MAALKCARAWTMDPHSLADRVARDSYGRLLAHLAFRAGNLAAAEDALSDAFAAALRVWPQTGPPDQPEAWLIAAARRKLVDAHRRAQVAAAGAAALIDAADEAAAAVDAAALPDRRLGLLLTCAHPALEPSVQTALMLNVVLGQSAEAIAAAFLVAPSAMGQRLVRAKAKLKAVGARFDDGVGADTAGRIAPVLDAIYAAFAAGWSALTDRGDRRFGLAAEATYLARLAAQLAPQSAEAWGLAALLVHLNAREGARRDAGGALIPLAEQDASFWDHALIDEAEALLRHSAGIAAGGAPGRFQLEAAIQSVHADRRRTGRTDWAAIVGFYALLAEEAGSPVAALNALAAKSQIAPAADVLARVEALMAAHPALRSYQPAWALKAYLLCDVGDLAAAARAFDEAIARANDPAIIAHLNARRMALARGREN